MTFQKKRAPFPSQALLQTLLQQVPHVWGAFVIFKAKLHISMLRVFLDCIFALYHKHIELPCLLGGSSGISLMTFHRFPLPLLRRALSMSLFVLSALPNGSPLSFPMISMGSLGRWRRASPRAAASARLCLSSSSSLAIATASRIWFEKVVGDSAASSLTVRPSWVRVKMLSP